MKLFSTSYTAHNVHVLHAYECKALFLYLKYRNYEYMSERVREKCVGNNINVCTHTRTQICTLKYVYLQIEVITSICCSCTQPAMVRGKGKMRFYCIAYGCLCLCKAWIYLYLHTSIAQISVMWLLECVCEHCSLPLCMNGNVYRDMSVSADVYVRVFIRFQTHFKKG